MKLFLMMITCGLLASCVSTAPISVAWRSNANMQTASTDGTTTNTEQSPAVNADKTTENQAAVTTSSGSATTNDNRKSEPADEGSKEDPVEAGEADADAVKNTAEGGDEK